MSRGDAIVIVPTYNERENVRELADRIRALAPPVDLLFIDDASPDGTGAVAEELARSSARISVLHRPGKLGLGSALLLGYRTALERDYPLVVQMDADLSHDPAAIPELLRAAAEHDLVLGSRYVGGVRVIDWEIGRVLLSYAANLYARAITGLPVHDTTTGFRCFRGELLRRIDLGRVRTRGYGFQIEMAYRAWKAGARLCEVPITFYGRQRGASKMTRAMIVEAMVLVWRLRLGLI